MTNKSLNYSKNNFLAIYFEILRQQNPKFQDMTCSKSFAYFWT